MGFPLSMWRLLNASGRTPHSPAVAASEIVYMEGRNAAPGGAARRSAFQFSLSHCPSWPEPQSIPTLIARFPRGSERRKFFVNSPGYTSSWRLAKFLVVAFRLFSFGEQPGPMGRFHLGQERLLVLDELGRRLAL